MEFYAKEPIKYNSILITSVNRVFYINMGKFNYLSSGLQYFLFISFYKDTKFFLKCLGIVNRVNKHHNFNVLINISFLCKRS